MNPDLQEEVDSDSLYRRQAYGERMSQALAALNDTSLSDPSGQHTRKPWWKFWRRK